MDDHREDCADNYLSLPQYQLISVNRAPDIDMNKSNKHRVISIQAYVSATQLSLFIVIYLFHFCYVKNELW